MKPARFDYARPASLDEAVALLGTGAGVVKCLAGGQSLGPMLNLRLVQPDLLVDITRIPELTRVEEDGDGLLLGACTTHAAIEDGRVPDVTGGVLPAVAQGIAYRAVRSRGTIGGSLAHADPAADWITCLTALGAEVVIRGASGRRELALPALMRGVFETALEADEILEAVRIPRLGPGARWGYYKVNRKPGEFAHAIGAVLYDPERGICRAVAGATESRPIVIEDAGPLVTQYDRAAVLDILREGGLGADAYSLQIHAVALERAIRTMS